MTFAQGMSASSKAHAMAAATEKAEQDEESEPQLTRDNS